MSLETIANNLCSDLVQAVGARGRRQFIVTTFTYPDGDHVPLYLRQDAQSGAMILSDRGTTLLKCDEDGLDMEVASRKHLVRSICAGLGVEFEGNALEKAVDESHPGPSVIALLSAIAQISVHQYDTETKTRPHVLRQVGRILEAKVRPLKVVMPDFVYSDIDAQGRFPIDFKVGEAISRHIFAVSSARKSNVVVATTQFLKANNHSAPTMAIVGADAKLSKKDMERLEFVTTRVITSGPMGHENEIVDFALADAA